MFLPRALYLVLMSSTALEAEGMEIGLAVTSGPLLATESFSPAAPADSPPVPEENGIDTTDTFHYYNNAFMVKVTLLNDTDPLQEHFLHKYCMHR